MRKLWIFAAVAALALTACQQEKDIQEGASRGENNVSFVLQNGASTRSGGTVGLVERGEIIPVAKIGNYEIFLEETIQDLNACGAETRGTPVYTENLGYLFRDKLGVHTSTYSTRDVVYQQYNDTMIEELGSGQLYTLTVEADKIGGIVESVIPELKDLNIHYEDCRLSASVRDGSLYSLELKCGGNVRIVTRDVDASADVLVRFISPSDHVIPAAAVNALLHGQRGS